MARSASSRFRTLLVSGAAGVLTAGLGVAGAPSASAATAPLSIPHYLVSAIQIDTVHNTVTLPLYRGETSRRGTTWFVITESSDLREAVRLGVNWSPKLKNALGTPAVQRAELEGGHRIGRARSVEFRSGVDFRGTRVVVPGPTLFPVDPATHAGSVGDRGYSPLFTLDGRIVYNGPQLANVTGRHGKVLSLDLAHRRVTLRMTSGFYLGRDVHYLSTEASVTQVAALENATYAPALAAAPTAGNDDPSVSSRLPIIPVVNGPRGVGNPQRQGLQSAVAGEGDPLNIIREEPECSDPAVPANCSALQYSPLWDVTPVAWTQAAIDAGKQVRITSHQVADSLFHQGLIVNAAPDGPSFADPEIHGLRAADIVVNCPPMIVDPA
ncbi:MAG: hypothetical protein U0Q19_14235 [Kineosporiaceae bacterium]